MKSFTTGSERGKGVRLRNLRQAGTTETNDVRRVRELSRAAAVIRPMKRLRIGAMLPGPGRISA